MRLLGGVVVLAFERDLELAEVALEGLHALGFGALTDLLVDDATVIRHQEGMLAACDQPAIAGLEHLHRLVAVLGHHRGDGLDRKGGGGLGDTFEGRNITLGDDLAGEEVGKALAHIRSGCGNDSSL